MVRDTADSRETYPKPKEGDCIDSDGPDLQCSGRPDISIYLRRDNKQYSTSEALKDNADRKKWAGATKWDLIKLFVEVKKNNDNPFNRPGKSYRPLPRSPRSASVRGQIAEYASQIRLRQHRTSILSVSIYRTTVRFLRWDAAGVMVSEAVNLVEDAGRIAFLRFFYLLDQMTDVQLGWDSTVTDPDEKECAVCRAASRKLYVFDEEDGEDEEEEDEEDEEDEEENDDGEEDVKGDEYFRAPFGDDHRLYKVTVNGDSMKKASDRWQANIQHGPAAANSIPSSQPRVFIVGRPLFGNASFTGSCTKGFVAYEIKKKRFVFLKDTWRLDYSHKEQEEADSPKPETVIYQRLYEKDVINIPTIICGGDVYNTTGERKRQRTSSQRHMNFWRARVHTRLVIEELGKPLHMHSSSLEFVAAVYGALRGALIIFIFGSLLHDFADVLASA